MCDLLTDPYIAELRTQPAPPSPATNAANTFPPEGGKATPSLPVVAGEPTSEQPA